MNRLRSNTRSIFKKISASKIRVSLVATFILIAVTGTLGFSFRASAHSVGDYVASFIAQSSPFGGVPEKQSDQTLAIKAGGVTAQIPVSVVSSLTTARSGHTATALGDDRVLIVGGDAAGTAELLQPATGETAFAGSLNGVRSKHTATKLGDGRILILGGTNGNEAIAASEIFDPTTGSFTLGTQMTRARSGHAATVLSDGRILITGGDADGSAEIYDSATDSFTSISNMPNARFGHSAVKLNDDRVLIVGGTDGSGAAFNTSVIFDAATMSFSDGDSMGEARVRPTLKVLPDGKVQVIGGSENRSMEIYDAATGFFGGHAHLPPDGEEHSAFIAEIMASSSRAALLNNGQTITEINGAAVVAGGTDEAGNPVSALSVHQSSAASVTTNILDYPPGTPVIINGHGFNPNETVSLTFHEDPHVNSENPHVFTVQADSGGNFTFDQYAPEEEDLGITYILGVKGEQSGNTAQTTFHDGIKVGSVTVGAQAPNPVTAGNSAVYIVTVDRTLGATGSFSAALSLTTTLPSGATAAFSPASLNFPNCTTANQNDPANPCNRKTTTLTITTTPATAAGITPFTVRALTGVSDFADGSGSLKVNPACSIPVVTSPVNQSVTFGNNASFSASATGTPAPTLQWQISTDGGGSWNPISGAVTSPLIVTNPNVSQSGTQYRAVFTNICGTVNSSAATLTVNKRSTSTIVSLTGGANPSIYGNPLTVTAAVNGAGAGAGNPAGGTLEFFDGAVSLGTQPVSGGAAAVSSSALTAGTHSLTAIFTSGDANFNGSTSGALSQTVNKADPTITWANPADLTYGTPLGGTQLNAASGTAGNFTYTPSSGTILNAGIHNLHTNFTPTDAVNYNSAAKDVSINITKAAAAVVLTCPASVTYTGAPLEPCTATVTGAGGLNEAVAVTYSDNINAGTATATAVYAESSNHTGGSDGKTFVIDKAGSVTIVNCPASVTYTGAALKPCTAEVTGAGGLNLTPAPVYANNINAGTATANYSFAGDANHSESSDGKNFTVIKAGTTVIVTCPASVTYTGAPLEPCTATVTGANLSQSLTVNYTNNVNAGTATATANYAETANHLGGGDSKNFAIDKAASVTVVTCPASVIYDGTAQTPCTATVTGANLNQSLSVGYSDNINAGTATASASFTETTNHSGSSDSENFAISKAVTVTTVNCPASEVYTGAAVEPCTATVTGANNLNQLLTVVYANNVNAGTAAASASYAESANYSGSSDSKNFSITKAPTVTAITCPANVTYTGAEQTPCTASVTGANLNAVIVVTYSANINAGTAGAFAEFSESANHQGSSDAETFVIDKAATQTVVTCPASVTYTGAEQMPCSAQVTGANLSQAVTVNYADNVNAGNASASAIYNESANHLGSFDSKTFAINKAASVTTVICPASVTFTGSALTPCTATAAGAGGLNQSLTVNYANNVNAGIASASAGFTETANHLASADAKNFVIDKAASLVTVSGGGTFTYDGNPHPATVAVTGAGGLNLTPPPVYSGNCAAAPVTTAHSPCTASYNYGGDANHFGSSGSTVINIAAAGTITSITISPNPVQYSDTVTFSAAAAAINTNLSGQLSGAFQFKVNNVNFGSPVTATVTSAGAAASLTFNNQLAPNVYSVSAVFIGTNPNFSGSASGAAPLNVTREDARVFYTGMMFVNTASATSSAATVQLSATVKDITAVTGDAAFDANAGNISNATLTFVNRDTNTDIATVPISLVSAGDSKIGTAVYNWSVNIGSADSLDYTVGFRVNGYYTRDASTDNEVVTVSKPLGTNFITGGGYLLMTNPSSSAGQYAGADGTKVNFGFNVKYNNSGRSLQGRVNVIVRGSGGRVYQIKGNQMDTLTVNNANPAARTAIYTGKCNLTDITDPLVPISLGGGHSFQMKVTDKGEPGSADTIGINVYGNNTGALLFSSRWNGTATVEQLLGGGNTVVR